MVLYEKGNIVLREYSDGDFEKVFELFLDTVHKTCVNEYTGEQLDAWAPRGNRDAERNMRQKLARSYCLVAEIDRCLAGFASIAGNGEIDMTYVGNRFLKRGVGTALLDALEERAKTRSLTVFASLSAAGFFEKRGYRRVMTNTVVRMGVRLDNIIMKKEISR